MVNGPLPRQLIYVELEPPPLEDRRANQARHRESVAEAAAKLGAREWDSSDIDHWLVDLDQAARGAQPGEPVAWASYYRPVYRIDFAPDRDWSTLRRQLKALLPGWRIALWTGSNDPGAGVAPDSGDQNSSAQP